MTSPWLATRAGGARRSRSSSSRSSSAERPMRSLVVSLAALGLLDGCASSPGWTKAGASEQQVGKDTNDCLAAAQMIVGGRPGEPPRTVVQQDRYRRCMVERGYAETPTK